MGDKRFPSVTGYLNERLAKHKLHMTLLDPAKQSASEAAVIASSLAKVGTDAIMIGGSTGIEHSKVDDTAKAIREAVNLPVIIFPNNPSAITRFADAIYFMSVVNSSDLKSVIRIQAHSSVHVKRAGLEPIPMGYIIIEPGMKVGEVSKADLIKRDEIDLAVSYSLACEYFGMKLVYLEAGSGAPEPIPAKMISAVRSEISVPLIVGGGIRTPEAARMVVEAGADIIVTGTVVESAADPAGAVGPIIDAIKR